jgi:hypothetical protein
MRGRDQYLAVVVAVLFVAGLIVVYFAVRKRSKIHRNWDSELVGTRGPSGAVEKLPRPGSAAQG